MGLPRAQKVIQPSSAGGSPHGSLPKGLCQKSQGGGYFGWQRDWELAKQEIEW